MSDVVWAKVYLELPNDPKLVGRSAHDCYLWVCLILIAKDGDGLIPAWQAKASYLSKYARVPLKEVAQALAYFEDVDMVRPTPDGGYALPHFAKRQSRSDPTATQRQRDKRARERDSHGNVTGTMRDSHGNVTRDSHDTRAREEAEAEAEAEADTETQEREARARENFAELTDGPPERPVRHQAIERFLSEYIAVSHGRVGDVEDVYRVYPLQVAPGEEDRCLTHLRNYADSDEVVKRNMTMKAAKWLREWRQWPEVRHDAGTVADAARSGRDPRTGAARVVV